MRPRLLWILLSLAVLPRASAHEVYLVLTAQPDGNLLIETAFSDSSSTAGMPVKITDRASGAVLSDLKVPEGGNLTVPIPPQPYRVTFDGGPGHKVTKIGPKAVAAASSAPDAPRATAAAPSPAPAAPAPAATSAPTVKVEPASAPVAAAAVSPSKAEVPAKAEPVAQVAPAKESAKAPAAAPAPARSSAGLNPSGSQPSGGNRFLDIGIIFLLAIVSFGVGFAAGSRRTAS